MNHPAIYTKASGRGLTEETQTQVEKDKAQSASDKAVEQITLNQWNEHPVTKAVIEGLKEASTSFDNAARDQAMSYHQHKNHDAIIANLIQAQTIRNVLQKLTNS